MRSLRRDLYDQVSIGDNSYGTITVGGGDDYQSAAPRLHGNSTGVQRIVLSGFSRVATSLRLFLVSGLKQCRTMVKLLSRGNSPWHSWNSDESRGLAARRNLSHPGHASRKRIPLTPWEVSHLLSIQRNLCRPLEGWPARALLALSSQLELVFMFRIIFGKIIAYVQFLRYRLQTLLSNL